MHTLSLKIFNFVAQNPSFIHRKVKSSKKKIKKIWKLKIFVL